jgi:hypothetical protein
MKGHLLQHSFIRSLGNVCLPNPNLHIQIIPFFFFLREMSFDESLGEWLPPGVFVKGQCKLCQQQVSRPYSRPIDFSASSFLGKQQVLNSDARIQPTPGEYLHAACLQKQRIDGMSGAAGGEGLPPGFFVKGQCKLCQQQVSLAVEALSAAGKSVISRPPQFFASLFLGKTPGAQLRCANTAEPW